jgi:hypothetical protein
MSITAFADVEPNDDFANANPLNLGVEISGELGLSDANDYYAVQLPENGEVSITATYDGIGGFLYLYRSNQTQVGFVAISGTATLTRDCVGSGLVYVRASRNSGEGTYSLEVTLQSLSLAEDTEPNNTQMTIVDIYLEGEVFTGHLGYQGEDSGNAIDSEDWFQVISSSDGDVTLNVDFTGSLGGFIYLYRKNGLQLGNTSASAGANALTVNCLADDTLVVRISRNAGCGSYSASIETAPPTFAEDNEPNNIQSAIIDTYEVNETFTGHLGYLDADTGTDTEDWFNVVLDSDGRAEFTITPTGSLGGFIYLYSKAGVSFGNIGFGGETTTTLIEDCVAEDTIAVRISRNAGCGSYTASVQVVSPTFSIDEEPNNLQADIIDTYQVDETFTGHLGYFDSDLGTDTEDWYSIVLDGGGRAEFTITPTGSLGGFVYFYSKTGVSLGNTGFGSETSSTLIEDCLAEDTIVVRVSRNAGCGSYTGVVTLFTPPQPIDTEPNNTLATSTATFLTDEEFTGHLGYFDADTGTDTEDWFAVVLSNDGSATLNIESDGSLGGFVYLYSKTGVSYGFQGFSANQPNSLTISCLAADTAYARISRNAGCGSYTASVNVTPNVYANDTEPNNIQSEAIFTNGGVVNEGHIGFFDTDSGTDIDDWYSFNVNQVPFEVEAELQTVGSATGFLYFYNSSGSALTFISFSEGQTVLPYTFTQTGTYSVRISRNGGCAQYQLNKLCGTDPEVSIAEGNQTVCPGESATFSATAGYASYEWVKDGQIVGAEQTFTTTEPDDYFVRVFDLNGCIGVSEVVSLSNFTVPTLTASANGDATICEGESITIEATAGFATYEWSNGETGSSTTVAGDGTFSVSATTADGCIAESNEVTIEVLSVPSLNIVADGDTEICLGSSVSLSTNDAFESYLWSNGESGSSIDVDETGIYFVTGTTLDGCDAVSNSIEVTVFDDEGPCVIDCAGVPGGSSSIDECGVCDDDPSNDNLTCTDCAGVVNGTAFLDNCGNCVGGDTGLEPCAEDCFGVPGGTAVVDDCGVCRESDDPDFNSTCLDCAGVPNGNSTEDECGVCDDDPSNDNESCTDCAGVVNGGSTEDVCGVCDDDPSNDGITCLDCAGVPNGGATLDDCGVCDSNPDNDNQTCSDCEGIPNGDALPGSTCVVDGLSGTYGEDCSCIPNEDCEYIYFLASANDFGGSDVYQFTVGEADTEADLELLISLDEEVSLAYDEQNQLLYMLEKGQAAFKILDLNAPVTPPSEVITQYVVTGFTGSAFFDGTYYAMSENTNRVYSYDPGAGMGVVFSGANVGDGDIAFDENGLLYMVTSGPNRAFEVISGSQNTILGPVPPGSSGLALRSDGNFFLAVDGRSRLIVGTPQAEDTGLRVRLFLNNSLFTVQNGDLASGCGISAVATLVAEHDDEVASELKLQIMPNPTEGLSYATFSSSIDQNATLELYDMSGRRVALLFSGTMSANEEYRAEFDGSHLPNGVYIYRYTSGNHVEMEKLIIAR